MADTFSWHGMELFFFFSKDWQRQKENGTNDEGIHVGNLFNAFQLQRERVYYYGGFSNTSMWGRTFLKEKRRKTFILLAMFFPYTYMESPTTLKEAL